ncbi:hypothetical protein EDC01DRAFT_627119 [Geopyxis carbonaria]|nr:hypothetical protein EDC01DRAFT_627119 [Geopyxis carbonaria]
MASAAVLLPLLLAARFWNTRTRPRTSRAAVAEDGFILLAAAICETSFVYGSVYLSRNLRSAGGPAPSAAYMVTFWATISFYTVLGKLLAMYAVKAAFLCFYWRLYTDASAVVSMRPVHATAAVLALAWAGSTAAYATACLPGRVYGDPRCVAVLSLPAHSASTALYVASDLALVWLPLRIIAQLNRGADSAVAIAFVFGVGGVSVAATVSRFALLVSFGMLNARAAPDAGVAGAMAGGRYANMAIVGVVGEVLAGFVALLMVTMRPALDRAVRWVKGVMWWQTLPEKGVRRLGSHDGEGAPEMGEVAFG